MGLDKSFPKRNRIRRQVEFDRVYESDHFAADKTLVIRGRRNDVGNIRLGLSLSRRVGNAVVRNQWKRKIREAFRGLRQQLPPDLDIVIRPRKDAACDYHAIYHSLQTLVARLDRKIPKRTKKDG